LPIALSTVEQPAVDAMAALAPIARARRRVTESNDERMCRFIVGRRIDVVLD
jgi:hypothetical protein